MVPFLRERDRAAGTSRDERLAEVGEHYLRFGGAARSTTRTARCSPRSRTTSPANGIDLPVYWGNRNWDPYLRRRAARRCAPTASPGRPASSPAPTRRYSRLPAVPREPRRRASPRSGPGAPRLDRLRHYFNHPGFVEPMVDATLAALAELPERGPRDGAHLVFVTHSIPEAMNDVRAARDGGAYVAQHRRVAAEVVERVRAGDRPPLPLRPGLLLALRAAARAVAGAGRQRPPPTRCRRTGVPGVVRGADRLRLRPHGGHLRPRHRGAGHRRGARAAVRPGRDRRRRPAVRRDGARPAARAGRRRARRAAGARRRRRAPARLGRAARPAAAPTRAGPRPALCGED